MWSVLASEFQVTIMRENTFFFFFFAYRSLKNGENFSHLLQLYIIAGQFLEWVVDWDTGRNDRVVHSDGYRDKSKRYSIEIANTEDFWWCFLYH